MIYMKKYFKYICVSLFCIFLTTIIPTKVNANSITINKSKITLGVGYSEKIGYTLSEGLSSGDIIWTSSNENVATVINGKVIAISEGWSIITASINGKKSTCRVTVTSNYVSVTSLKLNKSNTTILVGNTEKLAGTISPSNSTNKTITWTSSNPSVATVDSFGTISAKSVGTTTITASISGFKATCKVTVTYSLSLKGISLNKTSLSIKEKNSEQLNVIYNPSNTTNRKITWKSSNTNVATVDSSGRVTALSVGTATITAVSNDGGYVATCKVTVEEISKKVTNVTLDKNELNITAGETAELKATITPDYAENKNVIWKSSDEKIATVENGKVTAKYPGTVEIKVTSEDGGKEAICKVTVTSPPLEGISFGKTKLTVYTGSETDLELITTPKNAVLENPIWKSSDETIATVDGGKLLALSIGTTTITVSNQDNTMSADINIIVIEEPKEPLNITIEGYNLNFDPSTKNYNLAISNESELKITTNKDEKYVVVKGNQNLKNGSIITITITEEEKETYIINIKKKQNYTIYFIAAISVLLLLNLVRILLKNKKKQKY